MATKRNQLDNKQQASNVQLPKGIQAPKPRATETVAPTKSAAAPPTPNTTNDSTKANVDETARNQQDPTLIAASQQGIAPPPTPTQETRHIENDPLAKPQGTGRRVSLDEADDSSKDEEEVQMVVTRGFKLHDDSNVLHDYPAGVHKVPRSHAEHWYAVANGATIAE